MAAISPSHPGPEKKHWWLTNRKIVDKYVKDARSLMARQDQGDVATALNLLDSALSLSPRFEPAMELKARSLLYLRRFKDVADLLQDYIPSYKIAADESESSSSSSSSSTSSSSDSSSQQLCRERAKLLPSENSSSDLGEGVDLISFKCFSVSDLKKKVLAGLCKNCHKEGQWRYLVLGQACCHLGLMEDAMVLLQTGKRLSTVAFRRQSISWSEDSFSLPHGDSTTAPPTPPRSLTESDNITHLLSHIKLLLRRRAAAIAALDAGLYAEAIRHFSKIVDGRRGAPQGFVAECYMHRAFAYKSCSRIAEAIADCNKTLALDPWSIQALETRASLLEAIRCLPDCLHDLEHLKLLYNTILRDRKLPGPAWKRQNYVRYREIPGKLCTLSSKIQGMKLRVAAAGETIDYYSLIGLRRGCSRSELERAHLLLCLRHKPDKATNFVDRCEFADERDLDSVKDRAKMSALLLYRLIQKGHSSVMKNILDEEEQRKKDASTAAAAAVAAIQEVQSADCQAAAAAGGGSSNSNQTAVFQGVFCRDLAVVGSLLSQVGFNRPIPLKYEALSC